MEHLPIRDCQARSAALHAETEVSVLRAIKIMGHSNLGVTGNRQVAKARWLTAPCSPCTQMSRLACAPVYLRFCGACNFGCIACRL